MNEAQAESSAAGPAGSDPPPRGPRQGGPAAPKRGEGGPAAPKPPGEGWSRQRWLISVALVLATQVALVFALGEKHFPPARAVTDVPQLTLADGTGELMALDNPTLFALPHANDFASVAWTNIRIVKPPDPPGELRSPGAENLGTGFVRFMQTNPFAAPQLDFKPWPKLSEPVLSLPPVFAPNSASQIEGELAQRKWLNPVSLADWPYADVIAPSRVQMLVDAGGDVVSAVLLPGDNPGEVRDAAADQRALELARAARFEPAARLTLGRLIFNWHTVPLAETNAP
jgi:hypothetical protein